MSVEIGRQRPLLPPRRRFIHFEAAAMTAQVWLDDVQLGTHVGGYTAFDMELPATGGQLRVAVNNSPDVHLIPSDMSDFFLYGGLTRNVWLYETGAVRLVKLHVVTEWVEGTASASSGQAVLTLHGECDNLVDGTELGLQLMDAGETAVWQTTHTITDKQFTFELPDVINPERWSPENPALYTLTAQVICAG